MMDTGTISSFDRALDTILGGGLPAQSVNILAGEPGTGKSIFVQQWLFHYLRRNETARVLYLTTLSEPPVKAVRYMRTFDYFDPEIFQTRFHLEDIGPAVRDGSTEEILEHIMQRVQELHPDMLVIDSFKAIRDLVGGIDTYRRFVFQTAVRLHSRRCTTFLVGEYSEQEIREGAEFAVADGIISFGTRLESGEFQRILRVPKLRGRNTVDGPVPFGIDTDGIHVYYLETTDTGGTAAGDPPASSGPRRSTGIDGLDRILQDGLYPGRAILVSGVSGTGKTTLALQTMHHALESGERVLYYSFEEPVDELIEVGARFGWDFSGALSDGRLRLRFVAQTEIRLDKDLVDIRDEVSRFRPTWVILDSFSVFLHRVTQPAIYRDKIFQLKHILRSFGAIGLLLSDIPADSPTQLSRMGVEETIADGVIVLTNELNSGWRYRSIEVYKMRQTRHLRERFRMVIDDHGIDVLCRPLSDSGATAGGAALSFSPIRPCTQGELRYDSKWLVRGEPGLGKSTLAMQFAAEGLAAGESAIIITAEAPTEDTERRLELLGVDLDRARSEGRLQILDSYSGRDPRLDLAEFTLFLYSVQEAVDRMAKPLRVVFDSITTISVYAPAGEFERFVHRKNKSLRSPGVSILDTHLYHRGEGVEGSTLLNGYDIVVDLFHAPGERGEQTRQMQIAKARTVAVDASARTYAIDPHRGIEVLPE